MREEQRSKLEKMKLKAKMFLELQHFLGLVKMREYYNNGCSLGHARSMALLKDLNILPFQERVVKLLKAKTVFFKVLNGLLPN